MNTTDKPPFVVVTSSVDIPEQRVRDLLVSAFEGGSAYWAEIVRYEFPKGIIQKDFQAGGKFTDPDDYYPSYILIPFHPGCAVILRDKEDEERNTFTLTREKLQEGLRLMAKAEMCPAFHFQNFINENDDAETGDVFLQLALFGEIVYG